MIGTPTSSAGRIAAVARLELGEVRRSRWLVVCGVLYGLMALLFVLIGLGESSVLAFTGMSRVLASIAQALVILLPLLALAGSALVVNRARESGSLELLFSQPLSRQEYLIGVTVVRFGALLAPLVILLPVLAILGREAFGEAMPWALLGRMLVVSAALVWAFVGIGLALSTRVKEPSRAMVYALVVWALAAAFLDFGLIGLMLQLPLRPDAVFLIAALNPVEAARLGVLSGIEPSLDTLGPVGIFLVQRFGSGWMLAAGALWPAAVGWGGWWLARRTLGQADVVSS